MCVCVCMCMYVCGLLGVIITYWIHGAVPRPFTLKGPYTNSWRLPFTARLLTGSCFPSTFIN